MFYTNIGTARSKYIKALLRRDTLCMTVIFSYRKIIYTCSVQQNTPP